MARGFGFPRNFHAENALQDRVRMQTLGFGPHTPRGDEAFQGVSGRGGARLAIFPGAKRADVSGRKPLQLAKLKPPRGGARLSKKGGSGTVGKTGPGANTS